MVYESGFTSRRTYSSRPVVTSYSVSYPNVTKVERVYKTSYPIYSTSSYTRGSRVISSPVRVITSPTRVISSPVRVITSPTRVITRVVHSPSPVRVVRSTTTRVITSPERVSSYTYTTPTTYTSTYLPSSYIPSTYYSSYTPSYISPYSSTTRGYTTPSYFYSPAGRIYNLAPVRVPPGRVTPIRVSPVRASPVRVATSPVRKTSSYSQRIAGSGSRALTSYLASDAFNTFEEETGKIRNKSFTLIRDLHAPVVCRARSNTPFPIIGYEPVSELALGSYVSRVTNPVRHIAKEVHKMTKYADPARRYIGKSHLASIRICGDKAYDVRRPMYDPEIVRNNITFLSWYLKRPTVKNENAKNEEIDTVDTVSAAGLED
uniref:Uncharacterized protein n=1 Tax=Stomoxys calcitrans TaxID=35570 RepID=A0A1I8PKP9_STOCA